MLAFRTGYLDLFSLYLDVCPYNLSKESLLDTLAAYGAFHKPEVDPRSYIKLLSNPGMHPD